MKIALLIVMYIAAHTAFCQDDDTIQYNHGLPETGEDTAQQVPQSELGPDTAHVQISPEQVPQDVVKALDEDPQFKGWQQGIILFDKQTRLYWLKLKNDNTVRTFGFDEKGSPVSVREKDIQNTSN